MTELPDPVRRTLEIEDPTNLYFVHPIANRLTPLFARAGIPAQRRIPHRHGLRHPGRHRLLS